MSRVIIVVSGGMVQDVFADDQDIEVTIADYDNIATCDDEDQRNEMEKYIAESERQIEALHHVW